MQQLKGGPDRDIQATAARMRRLLKLRQEEMTLEQIGQVEGLGTERVRQILREAEHILKGVHPWCHPQKKQRYDAIREKLVAVDPDCLGEGCSPA